MTEEKSAQSEPGVSVTLPCGILKDKQIHRDAEIVPMTGLTRKSIAREEVRNNPIKTTDIILSHCLKRVGPVTAISPRFLSDMLIGDRDFLLLEIRRISMGDSIKSRVTCGECKNSIDITFKLDELETIHLKEGFEIVEKIQLAEGMLEMPDGIRVFRVDVPASAAHKGVAAKFRYPNGGDQAIVIEHIRKNPIAANYKLYSACLVEWNGEVGPFRETFFDSEPVTLLDAFENKFNDALPGPILDQKVPCPVCQTPIEMSFQGSDFLFHLPRRGNK
jgi:hypothetical protein